MVQLITLDTRYILVCAIGKPKFITEDMRPLAKPFGEVIYEISNDIEDVEDLDLEDDLDEEYYE